MRKVAAMQPVNVKLLQRESRHLTVQPAGKGRIIVSSATNSTKAHTVTYGFGADGKTVYASCSCPWGQHHGVGCSHIMAAMQVLAHRKGRRLSFWKSLDDAERQNQRIFFLTSRQSPSKGLWLTSRNAT